MARRLTTFAGFLLASALIFGLLGIARVRMEAEAAVVPHASPSPSTAPTTPLPTATTSAPAPAGKTVYLTFDDGPSASWTPRVLEVLDRYDIRATFFMLGREADTEPGLVDQVRAAGHSVGNHSVSHAYLPKLSDSRLRHEVADGVRSRCFRPPYGATTSRVRAAIARANMHQVLWDVDPRDWSRPGTPAIVSSVLTHVHDGSIVLLHDGGGDRSQTVAALPQIIEKLRARGYSFGTLSC